MKQLSFLVGLLLMSSWSVGQSQTEPLRTETFDVSGVEVSLNYFDQRLIELDDQIKDVVRRAFPQAIDLFGGLPKELSRRDYRDFTINFRYGDPTAEADPQVIDFQINRELLLQPVFGYITLQLALIHEILHFWNAETFRRSTDKEQWFNEGVTEYYAFKIAMKLSLIERDEISIKLALPFGHYLSDPGTGTLSMSEAGVRELKFKHYFLVYCGGLMAGMVLDYDVRATTSNTKSLDDLMRVMYLKYDRTDNRYTTGDIADELKALTGKDYSDFFRRYVQGREIIPVGQFFSLGDLYLINTSGEPDIGRMKGDPSILKGMFFLD